MNSINNDLDLNERILHVTPSIEEFNLNYQINNSNENDDQTYVRSKRKTLISSKRPKLIDYLPSKKTSRNKKIQINKKNDNQSENSLTRDYVCEVCGKSFTRKFHLTRHQTTSCGNQRSPGFICEICGKTFSRKDNLQEHLRAHSGEVVRTKCYKCNYCDKSFHGLSLVKIHERTHTGEKPYECSFSECKMKFVSNSALIKHKRVHTKEKPYECLFPGCDMSFKLKGTLDRHIYTHNKDKNPFHCEFCQKSFIQKSGYKAHLFYHTGENGFKCEQCGRMFNRKARLLMHIKYVHKKERLFTSKEELTNQIKEPKASNKNKSFKCKMCPKKFQLKLSLQIHNLIHNKQPYGNCSYCNKVFLNLDFLNQHIFTQHEQNNDDSSNPSTSRAIDLEVGNDSTSSDDTSSEICLSDEDFDRALRNFLKNLTARKKKPQDWSTVELEQVLDSFIKKCGHDPIKNEDLDKADQFRANLSLLFNIIQDESVKELLDKHSIDEVLIYLIG